MLTEEQCLEIERQAAARMKLSGGEMTAMAQSSYRHVRIVQNLASDLDYALPQCEVSTSLLKVRVEPGGPYAYPDVIIVRGSAAFIDSHEDTLVNPVVLLEVSSPSTESYDRGTKFFHYRSIESLQEYLIVTQERPEVDHWTRVSDRQWNLAVIEGLHRVVKLSSVACEIPLERIYRRISFSG